MGSNLRGFVYFCLIFHKAHVNYLNISSTEVMSGGHTFNNGLWWTRSLSHAFLFISQSALIRVWNQFAIFFIPDLRLDFFPNEENWWISNWQIVTDTLH